MKYLAASLLLAACATAPSAPVPLIGDWGGRHIALHLDATGGTISYDCAHGTIGPVVPGPGGSFSAEGTHTPEHGGPVREGEVLPAFPAHYRGTVRGDRMTLDGRVDNGVELGPFSLVRGSQPQLTRCL